MPAASTHRLPAIDLLRGTVMLIMLLDHVRETFYLHHQVADPMDLDRVDPALFASRLLAHLCAPVFVFLTGLSASLYRDRQGSDAAVAGFLLKRGLFLVVLELTLVNFAWTFAFPPDAIYLQVIWAIGLSMLALAVLLWLPRPWLVVLGVALIAGHNLFDGVRLSADSPWHPLWAVLHQRDWIELGGVRLRSSYPLLPWIGVIALGYAAGSWYRTEVAAAERRHWLALTAIGVLAGFLLLRALNVYGDAPWVAGSDPVTTAMSVFNLTKYPPSLLFVLLTLGVGLLLLRAFESAPSWLGFLAAFGAAPMFFYLLHLYLLKLLYLVCLHGFGPNRGELFGFSGVGSLWLVSVALAFALYWPTRGFARLKARRRDLGWLKYF